MSKKHDQPDLTQVAGFAGHVGSGDDLDLTFRNIHHNRVGYVSLTMIKDALNHRMASINKLETVAIVHLWTAVVVLDRNGGKTAQDVKDRQPLGRLLDALAMRRNGGAQICQEFGFKGANTFFSRQDTLL